MKTHLHTVWGWGGISYNSDLMKCAHKEGCSYNSGLKHCLISTGTTHIESTLHVRSDMAPVSQNGLKKHLHTTGRVASATTEN